MAIMKTANVNVRIQEDIKGRAEQILETIGVSRATAIDMFYRQIILHNGIPFQVSIPKAVPIRSSLPNAEFDGLMGRGLSQALNGESYDMNEVFDELENRL